jgi:hypothetical protein
MGSGVDTGVARSFLERDELEKAKEGGKRTLGLCATEQRKRIDEVKTTMVMSSLRPGKTSPTALTPFVRLSCEFHLLLPISDVIPTLDVLSGFSVDISVNFWQWKEKMNSVVGDSAIAHAYRNFGNIKQ